MRTAGCQSGNGEQAIARSESSLRHALACQGALQRFSLYPSYFCLCLYRLLPARSSYILLPPDPLREGQSCGSSRAPMHVCIRGLATVVW